MSLSNDNDNDSDDVGSMSFETITGSGDEGSATTTAASQEVQMIGAKENRRVFISRLVVIAVLVISAALTCSFVFIFLSAQDQKNFEIEVSTVTA